MEDLSKFNFPVRRCSAALPYMINPMTGELNLMLVSSKSRTEYLFPKGGIEPGLSPMLNAQKECREESGWDCDEHGFSLGVYEFVKRGIINHVEVFALHMSTGLRAPKSIHVESRAVKMLSVEEALVSVDKHLGPFIIRLAQHLYAQGVHDSRKKGN